MITPQQDNILSNNETYGNGKSFLFDFNQGDFVIQDGKVEEIDSLEALKMWIIKILKTEKNKFKIYDNTDYGASLTELITSDLPMPFIKSEIEREITEILLQNSNIKSVQNFKFERNKMLLNVSFDCSTIYGTVESEVPFTNVR